MLAIVARADRPPARLGPSGLRGRPGRHDAGHPPGHRRGGSGVAAHGSWTSVYTLNPALPAAFLRALARCAGVHIYNEGDDTLYASRSYLTINADGAGTRTIRFPQPLDLVDPFSGRQLARNSARWSGASRQGNAGALAGKTRLIAAAGRLLSF